MLMKVKGEVLQSLPIFLLKRLGSQKYNNWRNNLTGLAHSVYNGKIDDKEWYPMDLLLTQPTILLCDMFYSGSMRGAWDCGRYSAEYGLKGIYKVLVKLRSPSILVQKAGSILQSLYEPASLRIENVDKTHITVYITEFPDMHEALEYRIGGWMEKALEISGCKHVNITMPKSLAKNDKYTEFRIKWQKSFT